MKRLLAYLFVVLGLGIYFNDHAQAKNYCIPKKVEYVFQSIYIFKDCYVYHKEVDLDTFVEFALTHPLQTVGVDKESPLFMEENLKWLKKYLKENNISSSKINKSIERVKIAKAEPSQTQKVAKIERHICVVWQVSSYLITEYQEGDFDQRCTEKFYKSKNPKLYNKFMQVMLKSSASGSIPKNTIISLQTFNDLKGKTQIAKAEPSQTQKAVEKNIKFCVSNYMQGGKYGDYLGNTNRYKYTIRRFDNPYYNCKSNFIIDSNYGDELFYSYLIDTVGIVDKKNFRTLEPIGNWKPKNPIKPKKKVKVAKKEPKQEEFKPKKTNQDNEAPVIQIAEAITVNDTSYILEGRVTDKADKIFVEIDGQPVQVKKGKFKVKRYSPVDEQIKIVAIDQWGNKSKTKLVNITIDIDETIVANKLEPLNPSNISNKSSNNKVALIIGIENYTEAPKANYANLDAKYFFDYARRAFGVNKQNINLLVNEEATVVKTDKAVSLWLKSKIKKNKSDLIIFFAGHGLASSDGKELYLLPQDGNPDRLERTALSRTDLFKEIISLNPKSVTMFLDTCYSGVSRDEQMLLASARPVRIVADDQEGIPDNFTIFSASQLDQISSGLEEAKHGIFSYYLMKGLEGNADINQDKKITNGELLAYMDDNVSQKAAELGREQNPSLAGDPDKVLISYR